MKMLMFDFRDSEISYFNKYDLTDFEIEFIKEPLNEMSVLTEKQLCETDIVSVYITSSVTEKVIKKFKNLRIISTRSTRYGHIDLKYCTQNNIAVFNVNEYGENAAAQYTFLLVLSIIRKLIPSYTDMQRGLINHEKYEGKELENLTIGIVGCNKTGRSVAKIANNFGMKINVCDYKKDNEIFPFTNYCSFDELLQESDVITLHLPYTSETHHIINEDALKKIKKGAVLINISRGELVDVIALYNSLAEGHIGGAALDSIECDKIVVNSLPIDTESEHSACITKALAVQKLLGMPNVIITPHIAYNTRETNENILSSMFNSLRDFTKGLHTNQLR